MSENLKTIKELADEFNVSKQAVRKRLTEEFRANHVETITSNGVKTLVVTYTGYMLLKQHFTTSNATGNDKVTDTSNPTTGDLSVVKILEQQLFVKDKQIETLSNLLDQQQRLALQDKKLLEEYKSEINDLKALKIPAEGSQAEQANSQPKEEVKALKFEIRALQEELNKQKIHSQEEREKLKAELTTPKKWYQFWK